MEKICEMTPELIEGKYMVISFHYLDLIKLFDQKIPTFSIFINDNGNLSIISHEVVKNVK